jgi:uncharacterized protein YcgI (DUF1989 family)
MVDIFNAETQLAEQMKKGNQIVVVDLKGKKHFGHDAINALNKYEDKKRSKGKENDYFIFTHTSKISKNKKQIKFKIDLRESNLFKKPKDKKGNGKKKKG